MVQIFQSTKGINLLPLQDFLKKCVTHTGWCGWCGIHNLPICNCFRERCHRCRFLDITSICLNGININTDVVIFALRTAIVTVIAVVISCIKALVVDCVVVIVFAIVFAVVFTLSWICNGVTSSTQCLLRIVVPRRLGKLSRTTLLVGWWFVLFVRLCRAPNFNLSSVICSWLNVSLSVVSPTRICNVTPTQNNPQSIPLICCGHLRSLVLNIPQWLSAPTSCLMIHSCTPYHGSPGKCVCWFFVGFVSIDLLEANESTVKSYSEM